MDNYVRPSAKPKTEKTYEEIIRNHLQPDIGGWDMDTITPLEVQKYVTRLLRSGNLTTGGGLSPNTVNLLVTVMQSALRSACEMGITENTVWERIKRPKAAEREIQCFTQEEQRKIELGVAESSKPKLFGIVICLYTGLRLGELLALEWNDVDLTGGEIHVTKTCHDRAVGGAAVRVTNSPKTPSSKRIIPIPKRIIPALKRLKRLSRSKFVISENGEHIIVRSYQRSFELFLKKIGVEVRGFHTLRHTFATRALECGVDVKTLAEIMGHKSADVTLNRYVHALPGHKRDMMNRLNRLFCEQ